MKVKLTSSILWNGEHKEPGAVLDVTESDAYNLVGRQRAVFHVEEAPKAENRSVGLETSTETTNVVKRAYKRKPKNAG